MARRVKNGSIHPMAYVFLALFLFSASVMAHIFFCRVTAKPGLQAKAYLFIAGLFLGIYAWGTSIIQQTGVLPVQSLWGWPFIFSAGFIYLLLIPIYLCFYVLTQLESPSKKILRAIADRGSMSHGDIVHIVQKEDFIDSRLNDLVTSGCVTLVQGRYQLSSSGQKIAGFLNMMQFVLGRGMGG